MTTASLKINIINKITQLQDSTVIKEIQRVLDFELEQGIYKLTEPQKKRISAAKIEVKKKQFVSDIVANKQIAEWLEK